MTVDEAMAHAVEVQKLHRLANASYISNNGLAKQAETATIVIDMATQLRAIGWQDISTAPKDGSELLVFDGQSIQVAKWFVVDDPQSQGSGFWENSWDGAGMSPTHWMPLPPPPVKA
jgi:hypothetical protein